MTGATKTLIAFHIVKRPVDRGHGVGKALADVNQDRWLAAALPSRLHQKYAYAVYSLAENECVL